MFEIRRYSQEAQQEWDDFVNHSKNGTFLFQRAYMDYHHDRFHDCSLMFYLRDRLYALLPANAAGDTLQSHGGLTYGGLIMNSHATADNIVTLFREMNEWLHAAGFRHVLYKAVPWIYHTQPAEEDLYAIYRTCNARLAARDISSTIDLRHPMKWRYNRTYGLHRAQKNQIIVERSDDYEGFWRVLCWNLEHTYGAKPVHSLQEMLLLHRRFTDNIRLYVARKDGEVEAGTVLYLYKNIAHTQYISANAEGKKVCALDMLFDTILHKELTGYDYFDFGKSTEEQGHVLNTSLIFQKEGFGGRGVCYDWYEWDI